jgi:arylsulfatase A-like enzyme
VRKPAPGRARARDEAETVSFFLRRLDEHAASGAPFLAIYYSFIAHWPYPDYGAESHVLSPTRPLNLYYNDLHYLDAQIARIFHHLEERKLLERTIVVLVGDHGEAFGQHAHNFTHSRMSYNENLRTPAIIYQPQLFPPRRFSVPTSHVDILPTLLDALGVRYDPTLVQGESLRGKSLRRRYIFIYGNEDTLSSVSTDLIKLQISLRDGSCWVFDLKSDPEEHRRLSCQGHSEQQQALLIYRRHQQSALRRYNRAARHGAGTQAPHDYVLLGRLQAGHSP